VLTAKSIRAKMLWGLATLVLLIGTMFYSSTSGLFAYHRTVSDLDLSIRETPRSADLIASITSLTSPFSIPVSERGPDRGIAASLQEAEFMHALENVRGQVDEFQRKLLAMPRSMHQNRLFETAYRPFFGQIDKRLNLLHGEGSCLHKTEGREIHQQRILQEVGRLVSDIQSMPDPSTELFERLETAQKEYNWHLSVVTLTGAAGTILFLWLVWSGYQWLFVPLSCLYRGAKKVADEKDYGFRIRTDSNDEISELADAFNLMTAGFQNAHDRLEEEVEIRSRQLLQSARLADVGFLAAGVAHEINNPLSAIVGAAGALEMRLVKALEHLPEKEAKVVRNYLTMMQEESKRCRKITEKLLNFARGTKSERNLYDLTAIVREVASLTELMSDYKDRKVDVKRTSPCYAWVNGDEVKQVMLNLLTNALAASESGGVVEIELNEAGEQAEILVRDNGAGMTPDTLEHIFDPFFTTRETGKGTGLGLSISHRIIKDHFGALEATSDGPDTGSTFRIRLPANQKAAKPNSESTILAQPIAA